VGKADETETSWKFLSQILEEQDILTGKYRLNPTKPNLTHSFQSPQYPH
jgi:hypothetical protein